MVHAFNQHLGGREKRIIANKGQHRRKDYTGDPISKKPTPIFFQKNLRKTDMVAHTFNMSTWEVEADRHTSVRGQSLQSKTLNQCQLKGSIG